MRTWRPERDRRVVIVDRQRTHLGRAHRQRAAHRHRLRVGAAARRPRLPRRRPRRPRDLRPPRARPRAGRDRAELLTRMVNAMAPIEPELIEMDWSAVPGLVRSITSSRALVVLATSIDAPGASRGLLSMLPQLTQKHLVVVSSVIDPDVLAASRQRGNRARGLPRGRRRARAARHRAGLGGHPAVRRRGRHRRAAGPAAGPRRPLHRAEGRRSPVARPTVWVSLKTHGTTEQRTRTMAKVDAPSPCPRGHTRSSRPSSPRRSAPSFSSSASSAPRSSRRATPDGSASPSPSASRSSSPSPRSATSPAVTSTPP